MLLFVQNDISFKDVPDTCKRGWTVAVFRKLGWLAPQLYIHVWCSCSGSSVVYFTLLTLFLFSQKLTSSRILSLSFCLLTSENFRVIQLLSSRWMDVARHDSVGTFCEVFVQWWKLFHSTLSFWSTKTNTVLHDELHRSMCFDCCSYCSCVAVAPRITRKTVLWRHSTSIFHHTHYDAAST